jgi:tRNA (guanine-N7-)-methyltransferase
VSAAVTAPEVLLDLDRTALPLSPAWLFGRPCPLEVELGVGKGRFLLEWAAAHQEVGLLGVERARSYALLAAGRAARRGLANVRVVHSTAEDVLFRCLAPGSVEAFHVYFSDPWPKKRHHKRRFFRPDNVARLAELLRPGGLLRVKTDHREYAVVIATVIAEEPRLAPVAVEEAFAAVPQTHFEIKYAREGREFTCLAFRRQGGDT